MFQKLTATLVGVAPLLVHSERLANPRDPATRALKELTAKNRGKNKTDELGDQIAEAEWRASMYEAGGVPVIPADNILACVKEGARHTKQGRQASAGVFANVRHFPLDFEGPKDVNAMWEDGRFFDYRAVGVMGKRVMRARPIWNEWSLPIELIFDDEIISAADLVAAIETAGARVGLCEKRPQFGRFNLTDVEVFELVTTQAAE